MRGDGAGLTVLLLPPPTPNGPLHVGHLSGPYLAGDVAARAARARGERVLTVCGLDVNQNYVPAKAEQEGRPADEVVADYSARIRTALRLARISYDLMLDPASDADYRDGVSGLLAELVDAKAVVVQPFPLAVCAGCGRTLHHARVAGRCRVCGEGAGGGACERCGSYAAATDLVEAACTVCGGLPRTVEAQLPVLRMEDYREQLTEAWARAELSPRVRALVGRLLTDGLPEVPLAYPTDWGIRTGAGHDGERIDVWVETALGHLYAVPRRLGTGGRGMTASVAGWAAVDRLWHVHGIDNAFYYGVLTPALFAAAGVRTGVLAGLVVNEFYRLEGLKFSTSRNHAVWAEDFLADEDPAMVRLYLCWDRPEPYESDFTRASYEAFRDWATAQLAGPGQLPAELARLDLTRAERALRLETFDAATAAHCLLGAAAREPDRARPLLAAVTGAESRPDRDPIEEDPDADARRRAR
jgi:methionyl-tRNA synthetase